MSVVTEEMVERGAIAIAGLAWVGASSARRAVWRGQSMDALAAVAPMIAKAERERCAKVAEAFPARTHGALATAPYAAAEQAADEIASAIRALGDAT